MYRSIYLSIHLSSKIPAPLLGYSCYQVSESLPPSLSPSSANLSWPIRQVTSATARTARGGNDEHLGM